MIKYILENKEEIKNIYFINNIILIIVFVFVSKIWIVVSFFLSLIIFCGNLFSYFLRFFFVDFIVDNILILLINNIEFILVDKFKE